MKCTRMDVCEELQCRHLIPALNTWAAWTHNTIARPIGTLLPRHWSKEDLPTERSFDSQATWVMIIDVLGLFFDMLSMVVCTTRLWQTSGRLVQYLNVCNVSILTGLVNPRHSLRVCFIKNVFVCPNGNLMICEMSSVGTINNYNR